MPIYVALFKWTDSGVKNIKVAPARMAEGRKTVEQFEAKCSAFGPRWAITIFYP
jgi:uncharacterized protein with GYD domain